VPSMISSPNSPASAGASLWASSAASRFTLASSEPTIARMLAVAVLVLALGTAVFFACAGSVHKTGNPGSARVSRVGCSVTLQRTSLFAQRSDPFSTIPEKFAKAGRFHQHARRARYPIEGLHARHSSACCKVVPKSLAAYSRNFSSSVATVANLAG